MPSKGIVLHAVLPGAAPWFNSDSETCSVVWLPLQMGGSTVAMTLEKSVKSMKEDGVPWRWFNGVALESRARLKIVRALRESMLLIVAED